MNEFDFERVKTEMYSYCDKEELTFVIVGSVAYSSIKDIETCDDFDCVIIYDDISKVERFSYLSKDLYDEAINLLNTNTVDLFATKFELYNVKVSIDFISKDYFYNLAHNISIYSTRLVKKLTDAEEKPILQNIRFSGYKSMYKKPEASHKDFNIYTLPQCIYNEGQFFSGVLLDKFIHYPKFVVGNNKWISDTYNILLKNFVELYESQKEKGEVVNIPSYIRNWDRFSQDAKMFINNLFNEV